MPPFDAYCINDLICHCKPHISGPRPGIERVQANAGFLILHDGGLQFLTTFTAACTLS
jgi:hypothetical protein